MSTFTYTPEIVEKLLDLYGTDGDPGLSTAQIAEVLGATERSVIAKLSHLGVYRKRPYLTKQGELPVKKSEYIIRIAKSLEVSEDSLESLEKVTKHVLKLLDDALSAKN